MLCVKKNDTFGSGYCCTAAPTYCYEGYRFEVYNCFGPIKINKNGDISAKQSNAFFRVIKKWQSLPEEKREKYRED